MLRLQEAPIPPLTIGSRVEYRYDPKCRSGKPQNDGLQGRFIGVTCEEEHGPDHIYSVDWDDGHMSRVSASELILLA
ncbi:MAG: hypothetical protein KGL39_11880 [Patescibacteria group bacterium]|nr:hypothetical protein [Patescibacteria group bacterium]